jgi:hypothetical protein
LKKKQKRLWAVQGLNIFFWSIKSFVSKNPTAPDLFFLWSQLHLGKLHLGKLREERAMTGRIFQALPTQTDGDTITVAFPGITENDLLWASVCPGRPALPCLSPQTNRHTPCLLLYIGLCIRWAAKQPLTSSVQSMFSLSACAGFSALHGSA